MMVRFPRRRMTSINKRGIVMLGRIAASCILASSVFLATAAFADDQCPVRGGSVTIPFAPDPGDLTLETSTVFVNDLAGLVEDGEAARAALPVAFIGNDKAVVVQPLHGVRLAGNILHLAGELQRAVLLGIEAFEIDGASGEVGLHCTALAVDDDDIIVFLQRQGNFIEAVEGHEFRLRIVTGNIEPAARIKLARGDLDRYFSFGGYGSDARSRTTLTKKALERGEEVSGKPIDRSKAIAVGDTPRDVHAGHGAGIRVVGVATGSYATDELADAGADWAIENVTEGLPL